MFFTRLKPESLGVTGQGVYADVMAEQDGHVGQLLKKLDDLGIAENTIVIYSTDNGAELLLWPDGSYTQFRGEKNSNWEGAYRPNGPAIRFSTRPIPATSLVFGWVILKRYLKNSVPTVPKHGSTPS